MTITRDDIRAAVAAGQIDERQAASIVALSDARRGARENLQGLDEPFELFRGFNEVFIVVGLSILFGGWIALTGVSYIFSETPRLAWTVYGVIGMGVVALLARYFTIRRRMIAPSIALSIMFALSAVQVATALAGQIGMEDTSRSAMTFGLSTVAMFFYWIMFRVPFVMAIIALGVFATAASLFVLGGAELSNPRDFFLLSNEGPLAVLTVALGLIGFGVAMRFDMSDPHRVTRRSLNGFWLHIVAAPAIVNTVALTLLEREALGAQVLLLAFLSLIAVVAVIIDRRSFLVAGVGYVVVLTTILLEGQAAMATLMLGFGLVLLGATWEKLRSWLMGALPGFPGKDRLPPWGLTTTEDTAT